MGNSAGGYINLHLMPKGESRMTKTAEDRLNDKEIDKPNKSFDNTPKDRADKKHKTIDDLFEGYEGDYTPEEIDWGEPVGKETF